EPVLLRAVPDLLRRPQGLVGRPRYRLPERPLRPADQRRGGPRPVPAGRRVGSLGAARHVTIIVAVQDAGVTATSRKIGCLGPAARIASSVASASRPSKN